MADLLTAEEIERMRAEIQALYVRPRRMTGGRQYVTTPEYERIVTTLEALMAEVNWLRSERDETHDALNRAMDKEVDLQEAITRLTAEVAYLRRQIALEDNWQDPEFGGCTPDPEKPEHLHAASEG